jgi:serine/threonine protein kinase
MSVPHAFCAKKLAVKFLSDDAMMVPEEFCNGAADLLMEAKYLTALASHPHPSLIQLHGVCSAGPSGFSLPDRAGFFLVIDRLYDTLGRRMDVWRELTRRRAGQPRVLQALFLQRLCVAADIAAALRHLHKLNVVFRDLKPDNVGFDYAGAVKVFDFGLAKELDPKQKTETGMYKVRVSEIWGFPGAAPTAASIANHHGDKPRLVLDPGFFVLCSACLSPTQFIIHRCRVGRDPAGTWLQKFH